MRCIYCLRDSQKSRSTPHAFPEALIPDGPSLPVGAICDDCNHYAGSNLEPMLLRHQAIGLPLQFRGIPGKRGRPRKRLGIFERDVEDGAAVTFATGEPTFTVAPDGSRSATVQTLPDPAFRMDQFRRALYHSAFNIAALNRGLEWALEACNDPVRHYVRRPRKGERWTFLIVPHGLEETRRYLMVEPLDCKGRDLLRMRIFQVDFFVDLLNTGCLDTARLEPEGVGHIVGANWRPNAVTPSKPGHHYRASIF